jgi:AcrR family transcriptional regulator
LEPRKSPVQARSAATVNAILEATIQVLLQMGKERLTTTKVARRAGVSVGTLYQFFPNKTAMLRAALKRHMDEVTEAIELVCQEQKRECTRADGDRPDDGIPRSKDEECEGECRPLFGKLRPRGSEDRAGNGN